MTDLSGNVIFGYDDRGRLATKTSVISGQSYTLSRTLSPGSRVSSVTYPTGRTLNFDRTDFTCNISGVSTAFNDETIILMESIISRPFGTASSVGSWAGSSIENIHDDFGRLVISNPGQQTEAFYDYMAFTGAIPGRAPWHIRYSGGEAHTALAALERSLGTN